jgi:hypothetical protein
LTRKLNIEVEIHLIPTDKGLRLLASCNKDYQIMVNSIKASDEYSHHVPRRLSDEMIMFGDGEVSSNVLLDLRREINIQKFYPQPYSTTELKRVMFILNSAIDSMVSTFKEMRDDNNE